MEKLKLVYDGRPKTCENLEQIKRNSSKIKWKMGSNVMRNMLER